MTLGGILLRTIINRTYLHVLKIHLQLNLKQMQANIIKIVYKYTALVQSILL